MTKALGIVLLSVLTTGFFLALTGFALGVAVGVAVMGYDFFMWLWSMVFGG